MKKLKKLLSAALSAVLLACSAVCGMSASAVTEPIKATPLTGWTKLNNSYNYVSPIEVTPISYLTSAKGIKLSLAAADPIAYSDSAISGSKIITQMQYKAENKDTVEGEFYALPDNFKTDGKLIVYVKTDSANKMYFKLQTKGNWGYLVDNTLKLNSTYEYAAIGDDEWTTKTVTSVATATADEQANGLIEFDTDFEGYVKIPATSFNWSGEAKNFIGRIETKFASIGGDYGEVTVGPIFYVTADSTSTKIEVPQEYQPAPIAATPITGWTVNRNSHKTVKSTEVYPVDNILAQGIQMSPSDSLSSGYNVVEDDKIYAGNNAGSNYTAFQMTEKLSLTGTTGMIFYVKTDNANKVMPIISIDAKKAWYPDMALGVGRSYEYRALDADSWTSGTAAAGHTNSYFGVVSFDSAFEGFVKIPYTSLTNDTVASINTEQHPAVSFFFKVKGIGDTYGNTVVGPVMLITSDSPSPKIEVPAEFQPQPIEVKSVVDFKTVRSGAYVFSADPVENGYSLSIAPSVLSEEETKYTAGASKWSYVEAEDGKIGADGKTVLIMNPTIPLAPCDSEGFLVYLKTDSANALAVSFEYENGTHWHNSWAPQMMLKPGTTVSVCPVGSEAWVDKTVEIGYGTNTDMYGMITFDAAFEGYIKVPYSALNNDSGWSPYTTADKGSIDRIKQITFRFKGIGGKVENGLYGNVTVGLTGYITADSPSVSYNVSAPVYHQGDVNNDWFVNSTDLTQLRKYLLGIGAEINKNDANVDKDTQGSVDIIDLVRLKKLLATA